MWDSGCQGIASEVIRVRPKLKAYANCSMADDVVHPSYTICDDLHVPSWIAGVMREAYGYNTARTAQWLREKIIQEPPAARLIAAAPDLLEALREYVDQDFMACGYDSGIGGTTQSKAEAAIAKATNGTA